MKVALEFLRRERWWPLFALAIAAIVILPGLGSYGFWEPHEIRIADEARERIEQGPLGRFTKVVVAAADAAGVPDAAAPARAAGEAAAKRIEHPGAELPMWSIMSGVDRLGTSELAARLPLALWGLLLCGATFALGRRLGGARVGLIAALVVVTFPLLLLQSRQLMSHIPAAAGATVAMVGLVGLLWPAGRRHPAWYAADLAIAAFGLVVCYYAARAFVGLVPPLGAVALASLIAAGSEPIDLDDDRASRRRRLQLWAGGVVAGAIALVALGLVIAGIFDFRDPVPGTRAIFGYSLIPTEEHVNVLGGTWRLRDDLRATFDTLFEQISYGLFPWAALAPIAVARLALAPRPGRRAWAGYAVFAWALLAWVVATVWARKVGPVMYPAIAAVAVAIAIWLDDLFSARAKADSAGEDPSEARWRLGMPLRVPLVALFVALAAVVLAKDLTAFPDKIAALHVLDGTIAFPEDAGMLKALLLVFGALFGASLAAGLWLWRRRPAPAERGRPLVLAGRYGVHAALGLGLAFAMFFSHVWTPALSKRYSSKHMFAVYRDLRASGDELGVMGVQGSAPDYYAGGPFSTLTNRNELLRWLEAPGRTFAVAPASELCPVHRAAKDRFDYYVLDDSNARFLLLSNQLASGERDRNPLATAIVRSEPTDIKTPMQVNFDDRVELIGVTMPERARRGRSFEVTLYFKVLKPVGGNWKIFAHFDRGNMRFQGDHDPIEGRCSTSFWQPGDYIVDTFTVIAGDRLSSPTGSYDVWVGFFQGSSGNWTNMPVVSGPKDSADRVRIGQIQVR